VDKRDRQVVHRLAELGWMHNRIKKYIDSHNKDKAFGLVGQVSVFNAVRVRVCFMLPNVRVLETSNVI